ncbi:unnamed protein product [Prunus armeniaca]
MRKVIPSPLCSKYSREGSLLYMISGSAMGCHCFSAISFRGRCYLNDFLSSAVEYLILDSPHVLLKNICRVP